MHLQYEIVQEQVSELGKTEAKDISVVYSIALRPKIDADNWSRRQHNTLCVLRGKGQRSDSSVLLAKSPLRRALGLGIGQFWVIHFDRQSRQS